MWAPWAISRFGMFGLVCCSPVAQAVAGEVDDGVEAVALDLFLDGGADLAGAHSGTDDVDGGLQRVRGGLREVVVAREVHRHGGVGQPAVDVDPDVEVHHLLAEGLLVVRAWRRVSGLVVDADVDRERGLAAEFADLLFGPLGDFEMRDADLDHLRGLVAHVGQ